MEKKQSNSIIFRQSWLFSAENLYMHKFLHYITSSHKAHARNLQAGSH